MWNRNREFPPRASSAMSSYTTSSTRPAESEDENFRSSSGLSHRRPDSITSLNSSPNRPFVQEPRSVPLRKYASPSQVHVKSSPVSPSATYRENLQRRMEKQEARSLRNALEHMNIDDENRLYDAAQDEATELVWNHQHPGVPYRNPRSEFRNPDLDNARSNSERNGHFRSESLRGPKDTDYRTSRSSLYESLRGLKNLGTGTERSRERPSLDEDASRDKRNWSLRRRNQVNFALPPEESPSNPGSPKPKDTDHDSPQTPFHNSNGHIYEETQASPPSPEEERHGHARSRPPSLKARPRNSLRGTRPLPGRFGKLPLVDMLSRSDMHKNPPSSQSKNPEYITNSPVMKSSKPDSNHVPTKNGIEIRSDDIRAATSKKLSERSANLPTPVGVSDRPGRPIVSFDQTWKPADAPSAKSRERDSLKKRDSDSSASSTQAPAAPAIQVSEEASDVPVINLPDDRVPTISEMSQSQSDQNYDQPSPEQQKGQNRMSASRPVGGTQTKWYTRYTRPGVPTATCEACSQSIAGKIVTASGLRFHPECFVCYHCKTQLECIAFYQEPEAKRTERLAAASTDDREARALRFYCALDFHELFSPRCKSCKTPIEGEVVLACGAEWHVGHFFCAECGDVCFS